MTDAAYYSTVVGLRPKLWFTFKGPGGSEWKVYLTTRKISPNHLKLNGKWQLGVTYFGGRYMHRIYIDAGQPTEEFWDTVLHELMHVACRPLGFVSSVEESFVAETCSRLSPILEQIGMKWPGI